jgi:hypothetical protein
VIERTDKVAFPFPGGTFGGDGYLGGPVLWTAGEDIDFDPLPPKVACRDVGTVATAADGDLFGEGGGGGGGGEVPFQELCFM